MRGKLTIGLIAMMAVVLIFAGSVGGEKIWPSEADEQRVQTKESVKFECDPCDYNIDYGGEYHPAEKGVAEKNYVEFECDPCDYNIDYGEEYGPAEK